MGNHVPKTLLGLVQTYSPSGDESEAVSWLVEHMRTLGFTRAYADRAGNAVGVMGDGISQVVLLGHIDTVAGEIPVKTVDAAGDIHLYGRGSVDAKGPLAVFVDAAAQVGPLPGVQWLVIAAVDEERDSLGARSILNTYKPSAAIIGEPSRWDRVAIGYKGSARADVTVRRPMTHTASSGETAPEIAVRVWNQIAGWAETFNQHRSRTFDQVTPTLIGFSSLRESYEETAALHIGVRLPVGFTPSGWYDQLRSMASALGAEVSPTGFPVPAYRAERNSPLVRAFLGGIRAVGGVPGFVVKTGTADINIVAPAWNCPAVAYGPGDSNLDHTPDEHISLNEYHKSLDVLKTVLQRLAAQFTS
jgi:LysW-gamma-L-lysine carboxypeptidase